MNKITVLFELCFLSLVASCSHSSKHINPTDPDAVVVTHTLSLKQVMRSDPTWSSLANQLADTSCALVRQLTNTNNIVIYVERAAAHHDTAYAFRSLLLARIAQRGFSIAVVPGNVAHIAYQVQPMRHSEGGAVDQTVSAGPDHRYRIQVTARFHEQIVVASLYPDSASLDGNLQKLL